MLPLVPGPPLPSTPPSAIICRPKLSTHSQQRVDAETERQGRMRFVENKVLVYTQLVVINNQRLRDLDNVAVGRNSLVICKRRTAEAMACIVESKIICFMGNPEIRGGFSMHDPVRTRWLHLSMLVDLNTPLIIPKQVPVDVRHSEAIDVNILPMRCPNNCNL
jgi:hypothetical protein